MSQLPVPVSVLNAHSAILGKTGAGKSSLLRVIVEDLLRRNKRVCVVDPKGDWYGLKLSADGKSPGFPVICFGDFVEEKASDVPINEHSGKHVAELISSGNRPCVIGFRGWMPGKMTQFWIDFASTLFNSKSGELYLVIDECHNFMPKGKVLDPQAGKCLHWSNRIMSEARGLGIVALIASQRPQKVHNDSLTCCETLFAMRVVHAADRSAIEDWIEGCGDKAQGKLVLDSLAALSRGEAFVWSPENGFGPKRVQFPLFSTFDSFAPPQLQRKISAAGWAGVDLDAVKEKMAAVIEEAKANDPSELKRRIRDLEKQVHTATQKPASVPTSVKPEVIYVVEDSDCEAIIDVRQRCEAIETEISCLKDVLQKQLSKLLEIKNAPTRHSAGIALKPNVRPAFAVAVTGGDFKLNNTQQRILDAIAFYASIGNDAPRLTQIGAIALIDTSGGHFSNVAGPLSSGGLVTRGNGTMSLTDEGRRYARVPDSIASLDDYHDMLRKRVRQCKSAGGKTVEMLDFIMGNGGPGAEFPTSMIGEAVSIDHTGGHFANMIGPLSTLGLITRERGMVKPTDILFPPGLS